jgi:hypothetical protein
MRATRAALTAEHRPLWKIVLDALELEPPPTRAQEESVRRALKRLADRGEAVLSRQPRPVRTVDGRVIDRVMLTARKPTREFATETDYAAAEAIVRFTLGGYGIPDELLDQLEAGRWKPRARAVGCDIERVRALLPLVAEELEDDKLSVADYCKAQPLPEAEGRR